MPAISETGDITLSAELLLALLKHDFTAPAFRTAQEFQTLLAEYICCRDALDAAEVCLDSLVPGTRDKICATSEFLSQRVKKELAIHQTQVQVVAAGRHPLNDALTEYQGQLQRVVDDLGEMVSRPFPARLSSGEGNLKTGETERRIGRHLVLIKRTIQRMHKGILEYDEDSNRTLLDKNRQFMEDFLRPTSSVKQAVKEDPRASPPAQIKKRQRSESPPFFPYRPGPKFALAPSTQQARPTRKAATSCSLNQHSRDHLSPLSSDTDSSNYQPSDGSDASDYGSD